jgi:hypothetical protein
MPRKKASSNNVDKFNHPEYNSQNRLKDVEDVEDTEDLGDNYLSDYDKYAEGIRVLSSLGYTFIPHSNPDCVGHRVYVDTTFTLNSKDGKTITDVNPPKNFKWRKRISLGDDLPLLSNAYCAIRSQCGKSVGDFWKPMVELGGDKRKAIFNLASLFLDAEKFNSRQKSDNLISLTGGDGGLYVVPQKSWFDLRFDSISIDDLLYLFPSAESKMLQYIIGRIFVGRGGTKSVEGIVVEHKARYMGIITGEPRLGKSTFLDAISEAIQSLGFETTTISESSGRFGWAEIASSHFTFIDDLTKETQRRIISSGKIKQIVSNNVLKTENKGESAVNTQSQTVIIASSNSFNLRDFYNADSGIQDRIKILEIKTKAELCKDKSLPYQVDETCPFNLHRHWQFIADKYNVSYESLIYWLIYLCVQEFLSVVGYTEEIPLFQPEKFPDIDEETYKHLLRSIAPTLKKTKPCSLYKTVEDLERNFRIQTMTNSTQALVYFWRFCLILFTYNVEKKPSLPPPVFDVNFLIHFLKAHQAFYSPEFEPLRTFLEADYHSNNSPKWHPYSVFLEVNGTCISQAILKCLEAENLYYPPAKMVEISLNFFTSSKGFELRKDLPIIMESYSLASAHDTFFVDLTSHLFYKQPALFELVQKAKRQVQSR